MLALAGGALLAAFGIDGTLSTGRHLISTPATAVVSPVAKLKGTSAAEAA